MQKNESGRPLFTAGIRMAGGVLFVALLLTSAILLSQGGSSTPPMGYKIF